MQHSSYEDYNIFFAYKDLAFAERKCDTTQEFEQNQKLVIQYNKPI